MQLASAPNNPTRDLAAVRRGRSALATQLRFGFTYAYRFSPSGDADLPAHLAAHGGRPFVRALGFVGLDFWPGTICLPRSAQRSAFRQLVQAAQAYSHTFNITDDRWFNLRDTTSAGPATRVGATFSSDGLLDDQCAPKAIVRRVSQLDRDIWPAQGTPSRRDARSSNSHRASRKHHHGRRGRQGARRGPSLLKPRGRPPCKQVREPCADTVWELGGALFEKRGDALAGVR